MARVGDAAGGLVEALAVDAFGVTLGAVPATKASGADGRHPR